MAAALADPSKFVLPIAAGFFCPIPQLLLDFLKGSAARGPAFDAAIAAVPLSIIMAYAIIIGGVVLIYAFVKFADRAAPAPPLHPAALCRLFALAVISFSALLLVIWVLLAAFLVRAAGGW